MSSNSLANFSKRYNREKGNYSIEIELINQNSNPFMFMSISNILTKDSYIIKIDSFDVGRDPSLKNIFRAVPEIYEEVTSSFDRLEIRDDGSTATISLEVAMGNFRKDMMQLVAKKRESKDMMHIYQYQSAEQYDKVRIDKTYHKDYNLFKEEMISICQRISNDPLAKKINANERWDKNKLKNMFITFSNTILKGYRRNTVYEEVKANNHRNFVQLRPENKLLIQKNELLHNILAKAVQNTKNLPVEDLGLDFDIQIPKQLVVISQNDRETPLWDYLPPVHQQEANKKIQYYQKKQQQLIEAESQINLIRQKRLEDIEKWLQDRARKEKKLEIIRRQSKEEVVYPFQQF